MRITNIHLYRALRGGVWERTSAGWTRLTPDDVVTRACRIHPLVLGREDHTVWHSYILLGASLTVAACVAALWITINGV